MTRIRFFAAVLIVTGLGLANSSWADEIPDPGAWYLDEYGPPWHNVTDETAAITASYYAETIQHHAASGEIETVNAMAWIDSLFAQWREEDWVGSQVMDLVIDRVNPTTAAFRVRWLDRYADGSEEQSCGWYLADFVEGSWLFSAHAEMDCERFPGNE